VQQPARIAQDRFLQTGEASKYPPTADDASARGRGKKNKDKDKGGATMR